MQGLTASEARAEAAYLVLQQLVLLLPVRTVRNLSRLSHAAALDLGVAAVEEETCCILGCPPAHSLARRDQILAEGLNSRREAPPQTSDKPPSVRDPRSGTKAEGRAGFAKKAVTRRQPKRKKSSASDPSD